MNLSKQAKLDRQLCQRSLYYLCKEVLGYRDMVPHVHGDLCFFLTFPLYGRFRQAEVPRSWFKTWIGTIGKSIWLTLPDEDGLYSSAFPYKGPNARILVASHVIDYAAKIINTIKRYWENNDRLRAAFPDLLPEFNKTRWSDHCAEIKRTLNSQEGTYTAIGVGGSIIGQHFNHIIEDDLIFAKKDDFTGQELMPSQEDIDNAIGWHKMMSSLFVDPKTDTTDNIGTRWAPHDLIDYIRNKETQYQCFKITSTKFDGAWPILTESDCIWPERFDKTTLERIRDSQGNKLFETQYLGRPRAGEDITFLISYINKHESIAEFPDSSLGQYRTIVDVAGWKDTKRSCENVILTGCRDAKNHLWIARTDHGRYNPTQVIEIFKQHQKQFNSKILIEEVGYQVALRHFARLDMETPGAQAYSIEPLPTQNQRGAKDLRINSLEPIVRNSMLHILGSNKDFIQQMEDYPYGALKDMLDCAGFLLKYAPISYAPAPRAYRDPLSFDTILEELQAQAHTTHGYPFDYQLGKTI